MIRFRRCRCHDADVTIAAAIFRQDSHDADISDMLLMPMFHTYASAYFAGYADIA